MEGTTFFAVLGQLAEADPSRPALTCGDVTLTRAQFVQRVERLAALFAARGVVEGSMVTIGLPNSIGLVESLFAAWALGAVPQPISDRLPPLERSAIVDLASPSLVVGVPRSEAGKWPTMESVPQQLPAGSFTPGLSPVWKVVTSGGSTGRPKLIAATAPAMVENVGGLGALTRLRPDGCVLVTGPISHNAPFVVTTAGMLLGNHVVLMSRFDPAETLRLVGEHRVNWLYLVPTMMLRIWRLPEAVRLDADVSSLEVAFHMAAPCPPWLKQAWIDWLAPEQVLELYGGTELQALTVITGTEWLAHRGSVGRTVLGEIEIRDLDGRPVPPGEEGEIWMRRGPGAPSPYRYIGATARSAPDGWESLGDIGHVDADGYVYITDRLADMILVGGANVYPAEIEAALDEHPAVQSCCVIGWPDEELGSIPYAIVELSEPVSDEDLMTHLRQRLARYKLPRVIERATTPLRDDAGKVRRPALRAERIARHAAVQRTDYAWDAGDMTDAYWALAVARDDLSRTALVEGAVPGIGDGEALLRVDRVGLTANNVTYAVLGESFRYWDFFPAEPGWGMVPLWGFADIVASAVDGVPVGGRVYGYLPPASHLVVRPGRADARGFRDASPHRAQLPSPYNVYALTTGDAAYQADREDLLILYRPLFFTSFMLADYLEDNGWFGAQVLVLSSASSKTAYGTAFLLRGKGRQLVGLTSAGHVAFTQSLGCYDRVLPYEAIDQLSPAVATAYLDFAGSADVRARIRGYLGGRLVHEAVVGVTHQDQSGAQALGGPREGVFFAPDQMRKRSADWGREGLDARFAVAWRSFADAAEGWVDVVTHRGHDALREVWLEVLAGRSAPRTGHVVTF